MKVFVVTVSFILLLTAATLDAKKNKFFKPINWPEFCCFQYVQRRISSSQIADYYLSDAHCPRPAIIFVTKKDEMRCANPTDEWVVNYIKKNPKD